MEFLEIAFQQLLANSSGSILNLANPKWDAVIFVFLFVATLFYGLGLTRNKILTFLFSTYIALAIVDSLPFIGSWWGGFKIDSEIAPGFVFFAIVIFVAAFIFAQIALKKYFSGEEARGSMIYNFLLSFLHIGLVTNVILSSFPDEMTAIFSPFTQRLFMSDVSQFFWFLIPLITIIVIKVPQLESRRVGVKTEEEDW